MDHSWASWGHVVVLVFFDSEKVEFCFITSYFLSPFPFKVFLSVYFLFSMRGGGGHPETDSCFTFLM